MILFAVMVLVSLTVGMASATPVTQSITYQGKLTDAAGNPLTGTTVTFSLYEVSSGGMLLRLIPILFRLRTDCLPPK